MEILPNYIIFKEAEAALKGGKHVTIRVVGKSMEPFLFDNKDTIRIIPCSIDTLDRGDIVLFKLNELYCLHRILKIRKDRVQLSGDGYYRKKEEVLKEHIIGVLDLIIRESGDVISCNSMKWRIKSYLWVFLYPFRRYLLYAYNKVSTTEE